MLRAHTGTDANGNSVGIIFFLVFWQLPLLGVIIFGFTITVTLLDIRSSRHTNDREKIEAAVQRAFYNSGTTILLFAVFASVEFVTSVSSLGWRASLLLACTAPACFVGIYNQALWEFFIYDIFTAILSAIAMGFGYYFWYQVKTGRQQYGTAEAVVSRGSLRGAKVSRSAAGAAGQPTGHALPFRYDGNPAPGGSYMMAPASGRAAVAPITATHYV